MSWPFAARIQPFSDITTVIGSLGTSSVSSMACAAWRCTSGERRSSPNFLASACSSSRISFFSLALLSRMLRILSRSLASSSCSPRIFISSRRASCFSLVSRMYSAWSSDRPKRAISAAFGSSSVRMMWITSSRLRNATSRPSNRCRRRSTFCSRCCRRRVTVLLRNASHSLSSVFRFFTCGRPSSPITLRLTR
ncbi:hypothetical protein D3C81_1505540 [compost metagenome]